MKYILLIPIIGYYILRDIAVFVKQGDLVRGLAIFILVFIAILFFAAWLNIARELSRVKKRVGDSAYDWLVR